MQNAEELTETMCSSNGVHFSTARVVTFVVSALPGKEAAVLLGKDLAYLYWP
jgi:hypothetical protein